MFSKNVRTIVACGLFGILLASLYLIHLKAKTTERQDPSDASLAEHHVSRAAYNHYADMSDLGMAMAKSEDRYQFSDSELAKIREVLWHPYNDEYTAMTKNEALTTLMNANGLEQEKKIMDILRPCASDPKLSSGIQDDLGSFNSYYPKGCPLVLAAVNDSNAAFANLAKQSLGLK